jgi:outer membrane protein assembly factor BamB
MRATSLLAAVLALGCLGVAGAGPAAHAGDWPQILGPKRDGHAAADEKLAAAWPAAGPRVVWRRDVGAGYAGVAVVRDMVFLFHRVGDEAVLEGLAAATGERRWRHAEPTSFRPQVGGGDGPLCVPLVHGDRVITFGPQGTLVCVAAATGNRHWSRSTHREFAAQEGYFGAGSTPVVVGDTLIVNLGGTKREAGVVGFALADGATAWQKTAEGASYSAPLVVRAGDAPHVLMVTRLSCLLVDPRDGTVRWQFAFGQRGPTVNGATPVLVAPDRFVITASYGIGSVCASFDATAATPVWGGAESLASQYCTPILAAGRLYAIDGRDDVPPAHLRCIDPATGRVIWTEENFGYGTLIHAGGSFLAVKTDGELVLFREGGKGPEILARARPLAGTLRALPALAGGRLYLRDDRTLVCLDVGPEPAARP